MAAVRLLPPLLRSVLLGGALLLAGCVCADRPAPANIAAATTVCDRLCFGRAIPGGGEVTEAQWAGFLADTVVPRFPAGFTVYRADGHWKGDDGVSVEEQSSILEIVHPADPALDRALDEIATTYRRRFNQDAIILIRTPATQTIWRR